MKRCNICKKTLHNDAFYRRGKKGTKGYDQLQWACKSCIRDYARETARIARATSESYREKQKMYQKKIRRLNKAEMAGERKWRIERAAFIIAELNKKYGLTKQQIGDRMGSTQASVSAWALQKRPIQARQLLKLMHVWQDVRKEHGDK